MEHFLEGIALLRHQYMNPNENSNKYLQIISSELTYQSLNRSLPSRKFSINAPGKCTTKTCVHFFSNQTLDSYYMSLLGMCSSQVGRAMPLRRSTPLCSQSFTRLNSCRGHYQCAQNFTGGSGWAYIEFMFYLLHHIHSQVEMPSIIK